MSNTNSSADVDVVVVGAGFAGLYALRKLRDTMKLSTRVFEAGSDVGGTWFWNRYPGARCDIESVHYSYSFDEDLQQDWQWSEKFAGQPEILRYLEHVADRFDLRKDITFGTRVIGVHWSDEDSVWTVRTDDGAVVRSRYFISGAGNLSVPKTPEFGGIENFRGEVLLTGNWPREGADFTGKRVAVIGTGASAIQAIPFIAEDAAELVVFQRTPNFATPLGNGPIDPDEVADIKGNYADVRNAARNHFLGVPFDQVQPSALAVDADERRRTFDERWNAGGFRLFIDSYQDILFDKAANDTIADYIRGRIHERVQDPAKAATLAPTGYAYGTKRPPLETNYYEAFNRDSVSVVDVKSTPIDEITPTGVRVGDRVYEVDTIVLATGFDAMTGPLMAMDIRGRGGLPLAEKWEHGPRTYLGIMVNEFPNLFVITGPQSPSVLYNMPLAIEDHVDFATDAIDYLDRRGLDVIEPTAQAETDWGAMTNDIANQTLLPETNSWYMGANIPGKPRACMVYLGGAPTYRATCEDVVAGGYSGFALTRAEARVASPAGRVRRASTVS
ncbi:flavin-containing monooxygenase [Rhodococcus opacus]|uniref:flavin-containing monooxygenase n=1 Tax=Rhodococcus opacus TaxID=37919 RepID=UPI001C46AB6B|nr:NAD(P)/FAD-dependent oxidoreductase [Rhodococcus opacus]MBV6761883.1 NAD(P)/FAD-dependent oxidoreductase [Rhodococcus opacus]